MTPAIIDHKGCSATDGREHDNDREFRFWIMVGFQVLLLKNRDVKFIARVTAWAPNNWCLSARSLQFPGRAWAAALHRVPFQTQGDKRAQTEHWHWHSTCSAGPGRFWGSWASSRQPLPVHLFSTDGSRNPARLRRPEDKRLRWTRSTSKQHVRLFSVSFWFNLYRLLLFSWFLYFTKLTLIWSKQYRSNDHVKER